jgi:hypothetical protein
VQKKKPRETPGQIATLFLAKSAAAAASEGSLAYGIQPLTVAGPRPNFTAFPAAHAGKFKN